MFLAVIIFILTSTYSIKVSFILIAEFFAAPPILYSGFVPH